MGYAQIKGTLESRINCRVNYGTPKDVGERGGAALSGLIIDEVWAEPELNSRPAHDKSCEDGQECWGDYSFCGQLIEWSNGKRDIRLAYYRRRCGQNHWEYASQMTVSTEPARMKRLLESTLAKSDWFD